LERVDSKKVDVILDPHGKYGFYMFYYNLGCHQRRQGQNDGERVRRGDSRDFGKWRVHYIIQWA
jgi:hypothetical protein